MRFEKLLTVNLLEIVYGPVSSWRLGRSLGVDPLCKDEKVCSFDCVYCSLGPTAEKTVERRIFVSAEQVAQALEKAMKKVKADIVTFSGVGEPTLAENLGELIGIAKNISGLPVAVLTNSSLENRRDVRKDLGKADVVKGKLDAPNRGLLEQINRPHKEILFENIVEGLKRFRREFRGKFALEVMFVPQNMDFSKEIAKIVREINPDEVQINTPLRPSGVRPLTRKELSGILQSFKGLNVRYVYEAEKPKIFKVVGKKKITRLKRAD